jgi:hypothetical protein
MGYTPSANVVVDQATQFTTKAYVDGMVLSGPTGPTGSAGSNGAAGATGS